MEAGMVLYIRSLAPEEERQLRDWETAEDHELRHRAQVVLLSSKGYRVPEIARLLKAHPANLRKWIHRFNITGPEGLVTVRSGGAKPRFSEEQKARIVRLACTRPRQMGLNFTHWTLHKLAKQATERGIVDQISHECVRQILLEAGCSHRIATTPSVLQVSAALTQNS
jgi:transposase